MKMTVKMPKLAETADILVIVEWEVDVGDTVAPGDVLIRVETDKAEVEVPSPVGGTVLARLVELNAEVSTGTPIVTIEQ